MMDFFYFALVGLVLFASAMIVLEYRRFAR